MKERNAVMKHVENNKAKEWKRCVVNHLSHSIRRRQLDPNDHDEKLNPPTSREGTHADRVDLHFPERFYRYDIIF